MKSLNIREIITENVRGISRNVYISATKSNREQKFVSKMIPMTKFYNLIIKYINFLVAQIVKNT